MSSVLRLGTVAPVPRFDPRDTGDFSNLIVSWHVYESPLLQSAEGELLEPALLDLPLELLPGDRPNSRFRARVRQGRRFSDGTMVTAEHVARSLQASPTLACHATVHAQNNWVVFDLPRPNARFDLLLANHNAAAVVLETSAGLIGTGPYCLPPGNGEVTSLKRNPHYTGRVPADELAIVTLPREPNGSATRLIEALNSGQVDYSDALTRSELNALRGVRRVVVPAESAAFLFFNTERAPLDDPHVRRALATAIDRGALADEAFGNRLAFTGTGPLPPPLGALADGVQFDALAGRRLLAEARPAGLERELELFVTPLPRPYLPDPGRAAERVQADLARAGVSVRVTRATSVEQYLERTLAGEYDLMLGGWIADSPSPAEFLAALIASTSVPGADRAVKRGINLSRWRDARADALVEKLWNAPGPAVYRELSALLRAETPFLTLMYGPRIVALSWRLKGRPGRMENRPFLTELELAG